MFKKIFGKKIIVSFKNDPKNNLKINLDDSDGNYRFKIGNHEFDAIDFNERSIMYRFDDFVLAQVAKSKKFVAYKIVKGDLQLITTKTEFIALFN